MHVVFWHNILSPHQAPFLRSLADMGHEVTVVAGKSMTADRLALGWGVPDLGRARVLVEPTESAIHQLIAGTSKETLHVMAGARWTALGHRALQQCLATRRRIGILSEGADPRGFAGYGRWGKYSIERYTKGRRYHFVLAMGEMGVRWFGGCGYSTRSTFPFAYVTEPMYTTLTNASASVPVLLYVGQFIRRKGLDILLRGFAAVPEQTAQLRLLGDGVEKEHLQNRARSLGIHERVVWLPSRSQKDVQIEMAKADLTLLPSRHDGWGAVVNESLQSGTPVICSATCGAADLIREPWLGSVFRSGCVEDLAKALRHWIQLGPRSQKERERIRDWATCISGQALAEYFVAIVNHVYSGTARPVAPWRVRVPHSAAP